MGRTDIQSFVIKNWRNSDKLKQLVGTKIDNSPLVFCFGDIPTEKADIDVKDGVITRIRTWSGMNWSARHGYGSPFVDTDN